MKQMCVEINGISEFGKNWTNKMGNPWRVCKITDEVLFSNDSGPWMLLEREHYKRWVNLKSDQNFLIRWFGWFKA